MSFHLNPTDPQGRLAATAMLDEPVSRVRFCDGNRAKELERLGITRVRDLATHYPHRYNDMTQVVSIAAAPLGEKASVVGRVDQVKVKRPRKRLSIVEISLVDSTGVLIATWFNQPWMAKNLKPGTKVLFYGKVSFDYGFRRMDNPLYTLLSEEGEGESSETTDRILPVHRATGKLSPQWIQRLVREALAVTAGALDPLPAELRQRYRLMDRDRAWRAIQFPRSLEERAQARRRLAYEEMLGLQIRLVQARMRRSLEGQATVHQVEGSHLAQLRQTLPFQLTADQSQAVEDILADMAAPQPMNRLLLGDVGSGKTIVAAHALVAAADTGTQAVMMAPTEVLAQQYGEKLGPLLDSLGITWGLLTSATGKAERDRLITLLAQGMLQILFGTHAVLEEDVVFPALSLVVIDEQHRFGVDQRQRLGPSAQVATCYL